MSISVIQANDLFGHNINSWSKKSNSSLASIKAKHDLNVSGGMCLLTRSELFIWKKYILTLDIVAAPQVEAVPFRKGTRTASNDTLGNASGKTGVWNHYQIMANHIDRQQSVNH